MAWAGEWFCVVGHDEEMDETFRHLEACEE